MNDQDLDEDDPTFDEMCVRGTQALLICFEMLVAAVRLVASAASSLCAATRHFIRLHVARSVGARVRARAQSWSRAPSHRRCGLLPIRCLLDSQKNVIPLYLKR